MKESEQNQIKIKLGQSCRNQHLETFSCLLQGAGFVVVGLKTLIAVCLDFLTDCGVLLFPERLAPVLNTGVEMHLTDMARLNGTGTAATQQQQQWK